MHVQKLVIYDRGAPVDPPKPAAEEKKAEPKAEAPKPEEKPAK